MEDQHKLVQMRLEKLRALEESGGNPYPYGYERSHRLAIAALERRQLRSDDTQSQ